jgi:hypothetical protein
MVDSSLAFDITARDRGASSTFDKVARSADRTSVSLEKVAKVSDNVAKAETRLSKARDGESDAMGRVRVAEQRLQELRDKGLQGTSRFTAAEESLSSARRKAAQASNTAKLAEDSLSKARTELSAHAESAGKEAGGKFGKGFGDELDKEGSRSGKRFGTSLKRWITGSGADLGKQGGTVFGSGFLGALKTPILGPALVVVLGAAVATAMPAVGAIAAAGLVTGFSLGLVALGAVFAAKSVAVKNTWNRTLAAMGAQMKVLSQPFEKTLSAMADVAKRTFATFAPELGAAFKRIAPAFTEFGDMLGRAFSELAPAIKPLSEAFTEVLKSLGPATQAAFREISLGLQGLAKSVKDSPHGLSELVKGFGTLTRTLLDGISTLNNINGAFERLTGGFSLVDAAMRGLQLPVALLFGPFAVLEKAMGAVGLKADKMNESVAISAETTKLWTQGLTAAQVAAVGTGAAIDPLPKKVESLAAKFDRQWQATQKANDALTRMSGLLLTLSGSQIAYQQAVDDATASVKENGRTHDINSAAGRANKTALDQVAASANAQMLAMRNAGDGNLAAYKSAGTARQGFVKLAVQMGYSQREAQKMARDLIAIPNVTREARLKANKADLDTKLAAAKKQLADPKLTATKRAKLEATIAQLLAQKRAAQAAIDSLRGKTVTMNVVTKYSSTGVNLTAPSSVGRRADGGPVKKGMPYIVGEEGPELMWPDQAGTVIPNSKAKAAMSAGPAASSGPQRLELVIRSDSGSRYADFLASELTRLLKGRGADLRVLKQIGLA